MDRLTLILSWLCCKKSKDRHKKEVEGEVDAMRPVDTGQGGCQPTDSEQGEVDAMRPVDTGQGGCQPTDSEHQQGDEPPWVRKYFQAAPHQPEEFESGYFESDYDDDDDEDTEGKSIDGDSGDDPSEEKFNFPFHDSIFRFPHKDYDEIWETRRPTKRKTRSKKEMKKKDEVGEFSTFTNAKRGKRSIPITTGDGEDVVTRRADARKTL